MNATHPLVAPAYRESVASRPGLNVGLWSASGALAVLGLTTANPLLTAASILFVPLVVQLLWRRGETPVLLFVVLFQWLQVTTRVFQADVRGASVEDLVLSDLAPGALAVWLGLGALLTLALGQRLALGPRLDLVAKAEHERDLVSPVRLLILYAVLLAVGQVAVLARYQLAGLAQALYSIADLKWIPLFMLASVVFSGRPGRGLLAVTVGIELALGLSGYFGGFKTVFFVLILAAFTDPRRISPQKAIAVGALAVTLFGMSVLWTGIKEDYRAFVNQGQAAQVILVPWEERMSEMARLVGDLSVDDLGPTIDVGLDRLSYIDFFAESLAYVPAQVPHTDGDLWFDAIQHVLTPRILFPNKPILDSDSELTMRYTGVVVASAEQGSSISLGYVGESYIDFGVWGMWVPIFLLGLLQGAIYRQFVTRSASVLMGYGFALVALLPAMLFEAVAIKYLGGTLFLLISLGLISRFFGARLFAFATRPALRTTPPAR